MSKTGRGRECSTREIEPETRPKLVIRVYFYSGDMTRLVQFFSLSQVFLHALRGRIPGSPSPSLIPESSCRSNIILSYWFRRWGRVITRSN